MNFTVIIPARYASSRLPGKPLADIAGKPMIQLICHFDHIAYPIKQGIPILLSDQAISLSTSLTNPEQQNQ